MDAVIEFNGNPKKTRIDLPKDSDLNIIEDELTVAIKHMFPYYQPNLVYIGGGTWLIRYDDRCVGHCRVYHHYP